MPGSLFNKVAGLVSNLPQACKCIKKKLLAQLFSCEFFGNFKEHIFAFLIFKREPRCVVFQNPQPTGARKSSYLENFPKKKGNFLLEKLYDCSVQVSFKKDVHDSCSAMSQVNVTALQFCFMTDTVSKVCSRGYIK